MLALLKDRFESASLFDVYTDTLKKFIEEDVRVISLGADSTGPVTTNESDKSCKDRDIDVGIMEAHMIGFACGLSVAGKVPFSHAFGVFTSRRVLDQVFVSGCYNHANVKMFGSKPGIWGIKDGATHMAFEDIAIMRALPEMQVFDVADPVLMKSLMKLQKDVYSMSYTRFVRRNAIAYYDEGNDFEIGKAKLLREGTDVAIIASGAMVFEALKAAEKLATKGIQARVVDMFTIKPLDVEQIIESARITGRIVTAENHSIIGGLGSAVAEVLVENCPVPMRRIGVRDTFGRVGSYSYLQKVYGLDDDSIAAACESLLRE